MLHSHYLRASRLLLGISLFKNDSVDSRSSSDFGMPSPSDFGGAADVNFEAPRWFSKFIDATLGFTGEGPVPCPGWKRRFSPSSDIFHSATLPSPGQRWRRWALRTLTGATPLHSEHTISRLSSADEIHLCLSALADKGNSPVPIAARIQSNPRRLGALLSENEVTSVQARGGSAYNFMTRPFQHRRPRPIRLAQAQMAAVKSEISRLRHNCVAVENAPEHDSDRAVLHTAPAWEKSCLRPGLGRGNDGSLFSIPVPESKFTTVSVCNIRSNAA
jgi:hypothetical protein